MKTKVYLLSLLAVFFTSCDGYFSGMDIKNEYSPDINTVMSDANQYPSLLSGVCSSYWSALLGWGNEAIWPLGTVSDQYAPGAGNFNLKTWSYYDGFDKPEIDNSNEDSTFPKAIWYDFYGMINTLKNILAAIDNGVVYTEGGKDATYKILANTYFLMGTCYTEMALLFDQCFLITETTDVISITGESLVPASSVQSAALDYLDKCISICEEKGDFANLSGMFPNNTMATGGKLKQLANFMAARCLAYFPRNKEEAATVDWNKVLGYAKNGLAEDIIATLPNNDYEQWTLVQNAAPTGGWVRIGMRILKMMCPNDANAKWPLPRDFGSTATLPELNSPDHRLLTDFIYTPEHKSPSGTSFTGYTNYSPYSLNRFNDYATDGNGDEFLFTKVESDLIYAEALLNTGKTNEAVTLINVTREGRGHLKDITPASAAEEIIKALYYERFIECGFPYPATSFYDRRRTPVDEYQLTTRSFRQLPVPCYELKTYGLESYTFGGEKDANSKYKF